MALFNNDGSQGVLQPAYKFEVGYDHIHNEFNGQRKSAVQRYADVRSPLREKHVPQAYPKNGMFSIGERAKVKQ